MPDRLRLAYSRLDRSSRSGGAGGLCDGWSRGSTLGAAGSECLQAELRQSSTGVKPRLTRASDQKEAGYWLGIDPGLGEDIKTRFVSLGLADFAALSANPQEFQMECISRLLRTLDTPLLREPSLHTGRSLLASGLEITGTGLLGLAAHALGW
jgi:hypothetical protein